MKGVISLAKLSNPEQIIKISGRSQFVEVTSSSFNINQVMLSFNNYDAKKTSGSKITASINIYMDFNEFLTLAHQLLNTDKLLKTIYKEQSEAQASGKPYYGHVLSMGGTNKAGLARQGRTRPDGKDESRRLKLMFGDKYPFILRAESGAGKQEYGKLIKADGKADAYVMISMTHADFNKFFFVISEHIKYYMTAMYTKRMIMPDMYLEELNEYRKSSGLKPLEKTQYHPEGQQVSKGNSSQYSSNSQNRQSNYQNGNGQNGNNNQPQQQNQNNTRGQNQSNQSNQPNQYRQQSQNPQQQYRPSNQQRTQNAPFNPNGQNQQQPDQESNKIAPFPNHNNQQYNQNSNAPFKNYQYN